MTESQLLYCALEVINQIQFVGITEKMLESVNTFFEMNNISPVESLENLNASNTALDINESTVKKIANLMTMNLPSAFSILTFGCFANAK